MLVLRPIQMRVSFVYFYGKISFSLLSLFSDVIVSQKEWRVCYSDIWLFSWPCVPVSVYMCHIHAHLHLRCVCVRYTHVYLHEVYVRVCVCVRVWRRAPSWPVDLCLVPTVPFIFFLQFFCCLVFLLVVFSSAVHTGFLHANVREKSGNFSRLRFNNYTFLFVSQ